MCESLDNSIGIVVCLDVVHANKAGYVFSAQEIPSRLFLLIQRPDILQCELRVDDNFDIIESVALHLVALRQHIDLLSFHVDVDVMTHFQRVKVCGCLVTSSCKIFSTNEAGIHVDVTQCY